MHGFVCRVPSKTGWDGIVDMELERRLRRIAIQRLESLQRAGVVDLVRIGRWQRAATNPALEPAAESRPDRLAQNTHQRVASAPAPPVDTKPASSPQLRKPDMIASRKPPSPARPTRRPASLFDPKPEDVPTKSRAERVAALAALEQRVATCTRCQELAGARTKTVFGAGNPEARLVFLGEAPGADEDRQGIPFVGRAGQLLTKIIEACTLSRDDVYILNILKCRPPGNRNPLPAEAANCQDYLFGQLETIQPEFICCLGAVAVQNLLETTVSIGKLRGRFHDFRGIRVMATYHPAYLLRNSSAKRATWDDMRMLMREMGIDIAKK